MKNFFKVIIFIGVFLIGLNCLTYIFRPDSDIKQRFAGFYYEEDNSIDVIYIGSSPVHPYWAPPLAWDTYGFTSWSLATNVQQPKATLGLVKELLKTQQPKVVIFELRMFTRQQSIYDEADDKDAFIRNVTDNLKESSNRWHTINTLIDKPKDRISYYFDIMKYHSLWKKMRKSDWTYWRFEKKDTKCGHLIVDRVVNLSEKWQDFRKVQTTLPIPPEQEVVLRELLDYCKKNNIEALFTINPYTDMTEINQQQFNYMRDIVEKEYGYLFLNFNLLYEQLDVDFAKDFYNGSHMNICGSVKFTKYLAEYLVENYDLPDKREDTAYDSWNKSYEYWKKEADDAIGVINEKVEKGTYDD